MPCIPGIVAWVIGHKALQEMDQGLIESHDRTIANVGRILGMVNVILVVVVFTCTFPLMISSINEERQKEERFREIYMGYE